MPGIGIGPRVGTKHIGANLNQQNQTMWAGVIFSPTEPGTVLMRTGNPDWQMIFRDITAVALSDAGIVNATIATYAAPTLTGALDGSAGQIMTRFPKKYYREILNAAGEVIEFSMSNYALPGFKLHEKFSWGNGRNEIFISCFEGTAVGGKYSSVAGLALDHSKTMDQFNLLAKARGVGYHDYDFYSHHLIQGLMYLYYAHTNSQLVLPGYTEHTWVDGHEKRLSGRSAILTSMNGSVNADATLDADIVTGWNNTSRVIANRFMWIENPYGHCWKLLNGCVFDGRVGQPNTAYVTPNPLLFSSVDAEILSNYTNLNISLPSAVNENYIKSLGSLFMPKTYGGDSVTYTTDYFWSYLADATRNYLRVVFSGGSLADGGLAGVAACGSAFGLGYAGSDRVSRLCYEKN